MQVGWSTHPPLARTETQHSAPPPAQQNPSPHRVLAGRGPETPGEGGCKRTPFLSRSSFGLRACVPRLWPPGGQGSLQAPGLLAQEQPAQSVVWTEAGRGWSFLRLLGAQAAASHTRWQVPAPV